MAALMTWENIQQLIRYALMAVGVVLIKDNAEAGQYWEAASAGILNVAAFVWWWFKGRVVA